jgi:hypothetical protein
LVNEKEFSKVELTEIVLTSIKNSVFKERKSVWVIYLESGIFEESEVMQSMINLFNNTEFYKIFEKKKFDEIFLEMRSNSIQ